MLRRLAVLPLLALSLTACSEVTETAGRAADCAALARDVASSRLEGTPTVQDAEAAVRRLDDRVAQIDDAQLRESAGELRDRLRELAEAARAADPAGVRAAGDRAREAARSTADVCGLPVDQFLAAAQSR